MKNAVLREAEKYTRARQRRKRWHTVVTCLAAVVVFCTTYALILPAVTLEENPCSIPEHIHSDDCYTQISTTTKKVPVCSAESLNIHEHTQDCFDENGKVICGQADFVIHQHDSSCYDESGNLWCTLPEIKSHIHDSSCYDSKQELSSDISADELLTDTSADVEPTLICDKEEICFHEHSNSCFDQDGNLICGKMQVLEHQHTDACFETVEEPVDTESLTCTLPEDENHTHGPRCYGTWELTCGVEEHTHSETCRNRAETELAEEEQAQTRVGEVIALIDALPTSEEMEEALTAYDEAGDEEGYEAYYLEVSLQARTVYAYYEDLGSELQEQVTNRDKLLDLSWLWSAQTLAITDTLTVYQVNQYRAAVTALAYSDTAGSTVGSKLGGGMSFSNWKAIIVENTNGSLSVKEINTNTGSDFPKKEIKIPVDGFVIITYNVDFTVSVGDYVTADFDYKTQAYNTSGLGSITFSNTPSMKAEKDNSSKLNIVQGADTRDIIEVNLYDYNSHVNDRYNSNKNYPGFQQEGGSKDVGDSFSKWQSFNFGNNITSDLAAGISGVTNAGGAINATVDNGSGTANSPISGAMQTTLGSDGYPALKDGTSLSYLFSDSDCTTKQNSQSINGLFLYHEDTGAYTFNSRENHAQFNAGSDTFTLYNQIISSNFMMYPFGNFLPFNDIVHLSAQTSIIDRAYLKSIAENAQYKYNNGAGTEYGTLAVQLKKFLTLMDNAYPNGWTGVDCMNEYFKASGIPRTFTQDEQLVQDLYSIDYDEPTDFYFGMEMKMNFMQPKGGLTGKDGQQPMVFYFTGDDDVWVYIDGKLFLDLSGIHRHVGGEIDFVNGVVKYYDLDISIGDVSTTPSRTVSFAEILGSTADLNEKGAFTDYSTHGFNFYYMERGSGSGVCRMNFNFPLLRKNTIAVTKQLSVDDESKLPLLGNPDFRFQVLKENSDELFIEANTPYDIFNTSSEKVGEGITDANGIFILKAGQTAVFKDISENAGRYYVRELLDPDTFAQYGTISVSGVTQTTNYDVMVGSDSFKGVNSPVKNMSDGATAFQFDNHVTTSKLGSLSIKKTLTEYSKTRSMPQFSFNVTLDGAPLPVGTKYTVDGVEKTVETEGIITLSPEETALIPNILAGSAFTVKESSASAEGYYVTYQLDSEPVENDHAAGIIKTETTVEVSVNNGEKGTSVAIPVRKILETPDGKEHIYTLRLEQVTDPTGSTSADPALYRELPIAITNESVSDQFEIGYPQNDLGTLPATFFYKITEIENPDDIGTGYDKSAYVVEVTVTNDGGSSLSAAITNVWKDGQSLAFGENSTIPDISFANQIIRYELPQTGGTGTGLYAIGGLLLMLSAGGFLLYNHTKRKKGESASS